MADSETIWSYHFIIPNPVAIAIAVAAGLGLLVFIITQYRKRPPHR